MVKRHTKTLKKEEKSLKNGRIVKWNKEGKADGIEMKKNGRR